MSRKKDISALTIDQVLKVISIFRERSLDGIIEKSVDLIPQIFKWKGCSIFLYDDEDDVVRMVKTSGLSTPTSDEVIYKRNEGLTGWVFENQKPLLIRDLNKKSDADLGKLGENLHWVGKFTESDHQKAKSFMAVPLLSYQERFIGLFRTASDDKNFTNSDLEVFSLIARYVAMAIDNSEYLRRERRKAEYLELLMKVGTQVLSFFELSELLEFVAENTAKTIGSETCEIYLRKKTDKDTLVLKGGYGIPKDLINVAEHKVGEGLTGTIVKENRTIRSRNVLTLPDYKGKYRKAIKDHLKFGDRLTFLGMPINIKNETQGAIKLYNKLPGAERDKFFTEDDEQYLQIMVDMISVAIENVQYLDSMKYSAVSTMKNQRLTALGTLAMRIPNDVVNPLTEAQLSLGNYLKKIKNGKTESPESSIERFEQILVNLKNVANEVRVLQEFSTKAGFIHVKRTWQELLDEALLYLTNDILSYKIIIQRNKSEEPNIPQLVVDPNAITEVLVTLISLIISRFEHYGSTLWIETQVKDNKILVTNIAGSDNIAGVEIHKKSVNELFGDGKSYSPYQFSLEVVRELVGNDYNGTITLHENDSNLRLTLEIPIER
ncbi:GAF domain-containing protein [bacterium]|nr:GAF domain-containing protein [bacterium]MBU1064415.1 GAF domain-containing protein [bacterium]MBU1633650.1 GAF domain-containing protein [bacterium]MBU1873560.1 GAF domain-containing protein [bacterium]